MSDVNKQIHVFNSCLMAEYKPDKECQEHLHKSSLWLKIYLTFETSYIMFP
jgi:hypothetical protein